MIRLKFNLLSIMHMCCWIAILQASTFQYENFRSEVCKNIKRIETYYKYNVDIFDNINDEEVLKQIKRLPKTEMQSYISVLKNVLKSLDEKEKEMLENAWYYLNKDPKYIQNIVVIAAFLQYKKEFYNVIDYDSFFNRIERNIERVQITYQNKVSATRIDQEVLDQIKKLPKEITDDELKDDYVEEITMIATFLEFEEKFQAEINAKELFAHKKEEMSVYEKYSYENTIIYTSEDDDNTEEIKAYEKYTEEMKAYEQYSYKNTIVDASGRNTNDPNFYSMEDTMFTNQLIEMGYSSLQIANALVQPGNKSIEDVIEWMNNANEWDKNNNDLHVDSRMQKEKWNRGDRIHAWENYKYTEVDNHTVVSLVRQKLVNTNSNAIINVKGVSAIILKYLYDPPFQVSKVYDMYMNDHMFNTAALTLSHDNRFLFVCIHGNASSIIQVWDLQKNKYIRTLCQSTKFITAMKISADNNILMGWDKMDHMVVFQLTWSPSVNRFSLNYFDDIKQWRPFILQNPQKIKKSMISRDNQYILVHDDSDTINAWKMNTGDYLNLNMKCEGHVIFLEVTSNHQWLIAISRAYNGVYRIILWNFKTGELEKEVIEDEHVFETNHDWANLTNDEQVLIFGNDFSFTMRNIHSLTHKISYSLLPSEANKITSVAHVQKSGAMGSHVLAIGIGGAKRIRVMSVSPDLSRYERIDEFTHFTNCDRFALCFSSDGTLLLSASYHEIKIWDTKTGKLYNSTNKN